MRYFVSNRQSSWKDPGKSRTSGQYYSKVAFSSARFLHMDKGSIQEATFLPNKRYLKQNSHHPAFLNVSAC